MLTAWTGLVFFSVVGNPKIDLIIYLGDSIAYNFMEKDSFYAIFYLLFF